MLVLRYGGTADRTPRGKRRGARVGTADARASATSIRCCAAARSAAAARASAASICCCAAARSATARASAASTCCCAAARSAAARASAATRPALSNASSCRAFDSAVSSWLIVPRSSVGVRECEYGGANALRPGARRGLPAHTAASSLVGDSHRAVHELTRANKRLRCCEKNTRAPREGATPRAVYRMRSTKQLD